MTILFHTNKSFASDITNNWTSTTSLPYQLASHSTKSYNGKLYINGGANISVIPANITSNINTDGSLQSWVSSSPSPSIFWHSSIIKNNYIYLLGGATASPTQAINSVYLGNIETSGTIINWLHMSPLPSNSALGNAAIIGNHIYYAGGFDESNVAKQEVYVTNINSDGTIGSWSLAGTLPQPLYGFGMVSEGNHLIVLGGTSDGFTVSSTVYITAVNSDGTIGTWDQTTSLSEGSYRAAVINIDHTLYIIGGSNGQSYSDKVYYTTINSDGTVNAWNLSTNHLPQPVEAASVAESNGYLYLTGGYNGQYLSSVYYTKLNSAVITPTPNVPLLKQTSEPWQSHIYDSADKWNPSHPTINRWGCALTSAAMVFLSHGILKLPDGTALDPGTLNDWLKSQKDGYINEGWVNWLALSRLSKQAKAINNLPFDALEYKRIKSADKTQLAADLNNGNVDILGEPGHFIVGTGIQENTFTINDPFYNRTNLNNGYGNTFLSLGRYIPSHTDLSYIVAVSDPEVTMQIFDSHGNKLDDSFVQQPISDPEDSNSHNSAVSMLYAEQPSDGIYQIQTTTNITKPYKIILYFYDQDGEVNIATESGIISQNASDKFDITFDKNSLMNDHTQKSITFETVIADIKLEDNLEMINHNFANLLLVHIENAQKINSKNTKPARTLVEVATGLLNKSRGILITENGYQILSGDFAGLLAELQ